MLAKADCDKIIPLFPEFIQPQDGAEKQDCELNAAKRWLAANGEKLAQLGTLVGGDDLYSREPLCLQLIELNLDFIFVCKPSSHPATQEWLDFLERQGAIRHLTRRRWTGRRYETDTYRYVNEVTDGEDALKVHWCEITRSMTKGEII
ncbi:MAG: hypothetical protein R3E08_04785 [Thiotrichaceae bacterium]